MVRDSKRSLISSGGISGLYLNHQIAFVFDDILTSPMVPPKRGILTYWVAFFYDQAPAAVNARLATSGSSIGANMEAG